MILLIIGSIFFIAYAVLIFYYIYWWKKLPVHEALPATEETFISIVVAARNEEKNIGKLLDSLNNQRYSKEKFEIIIVDDHSTDTTGKVLRQSLLTNLRVIEVEGNATDSSKKIAIKNGVEAAKGELILITDADCVPGERWLPMINSFYVEKRSAFIAAPVKYLHNNSLVEKFQTIDFLTLQGITAASVAANFHSMCNGANLAYTKKAFTSVNGFEGIDAVASGDDMLLMFKIWKKHPQQVFYLKSKDAIVTTKPMATWSQFFQQRIRWAGKTTYYDDKRVFFSLLLVYLTNLLFPLFLIVGFFDHLFFIVALSYLILKTTIELPFVSSVAKFYNQQQLLKYFFFFQPLHIFYVVSIGFISQFIKYNWKGRRKK